jgi:hypothetical protein
LTQACQRWLLPHTFPRSPGPLTGRPACRLMNTLQPAEAGSVGGESSRAMSAPVPLPPVQKASTKVEVEGTQSNSESSSSAPVPLHESLQQQQNSSQAPVPLPGPDSVLVKELKEVSRRVIKSALRSLTLEAMQQESKFEGPCRMIPHAVYMWSAHTHAAENVAPGW